MQSKLDGFLNIIIGTSIGVFYGHIVFKYIHYQNHPDLYAMQSAPWYTSSLIYGATAISIILITTILKRYLVWKKRLE